MTLSRLVVEMIVERGCAHVDHLMPRLSELGFTRPQAIKALHNAAHMGFLWSEGRVKRSGLKRGEQRTAVYWPGPKEIDHTKRALAEKKKEPPRPMIPWVFDLGSPRAEWPKPWLGTIHRPLGAWHEEHHAD